MKRLAAAFFFLFAAPALAQAPQYCAMFYDGGRSCGIPTLAMCQETLRGVGGDCQIDTFADLPKGLLQQRMEKRLEGLTDNRPPAVRALDAVPPPPGR